MHGRRVLINRCAWVLALALAACEPERPIADGPNILFIVSDDLNTTLGCYGNDVVRTPNIDRLAGEGVRFDRAYCQFPMCGPSRTSFLSGLYPGYTKIYQNRNHVGSYRATHPDLADHPGLGGFLRQQGYFSARVSKIYHMSVPYAIEAGEAGDDDPEAWDRAITVKAPETKSASVLEMLSRRDWRYGFAFTRMLLPDDLQGTQTDYLATSEAIDILEERAAIDSGRPFFLAVGLVRPHVPLIAPERLFELYPEAEIQLPEIPEGDLDDIPQVAKSMGNATSHHMEPLRQRQTVAAYYASVTFMDEQVGRLLETLDRLDLRKNTVVIFTSDHGYNLGEHDSWQKSVLFEETTRVPLIVSAPGMEATAGQTSTGIVELIDLYPTFADLAGLGDKAPSILQGISFRPLLESPERVDWPKDAAYTWAAFPGIDGDEATIGESIRTPRWHYNLWAGGDKGEELYDHDNDPHEYRNLAGMPEHADVVEALRLRLHRWP